jgi:recombination protein RecA
MTRDALAFVRATTGGALPRSLEVMRRAPALDEAPAPANDPDVASRLRRDQLAGRLVELSASGASAVLSTMAEILADVQRLREPAAWIGPASSSFYPPDLAARGVDLQALVVVRTPVLGGAAPLLRAAERLLRSGAFGLVILDGGRDLDLPLPAQGRLTKLAQEHDAVVLLLTDKPRTAASAGSMVSLRLEALRQRDRAAPQVGGRAAMRCVVHALKDKRRGPDWQATSLLAARPTRL